MRTLIGYEFDLDKLQEQSPLSPETNRIPTDYFPCDIGTGDADYEQFTVPIFLLWIDLDAEMMKTSRECEEGVQEYRRKGLSEHVETVGADSKTEWKAVSKILQALQRKVIEFIDDVHSMLQQTTLDEDWGRDVE